jgi:hypothetical protein
MQKPITLLNQNLVYDEQGMTFHPVHTFIE